MSRIERQTFAPARSYARLLWFGVVFFAAFAVLSIGLAVFDSQESPENKGALVVYFVLTILFVGFAYGSFRGIRQVENAPVSIDDDGIWPDHIGKSEGLVRWEDVHSIKERQYGQRLELLGEDGSSLIKLEYQLSGFENLRQIVLANTRQPRVDIECPATFKKPALYHIFNVVFIIGFAGLAYYVGQTSPVLGILAFIVVVLLGTAEYLRTVYELTIDKRSIHLRYPVRGRSFDVSEVTAIELSDQFVKGARHPEVIILSHSHQKPIRLKQLGIDASALHDLLSRWKSETLFN